MTTPAPAHHRHHHAVTRPEPAAWLRLSAALTDAGPRHRRPRRPDRHRRPRRAGHGPRLLHPRPGQHRAGRRTFTDGGLDPATARPGRPSDRDRYPAAWGVFTHECAHARHTRWQPAEDAATARGRLATAATILEESRIEAAHLTRRPGDRHWLRAAATTVLPDLAFTRPWPRRRGHALRPRPRHGRRARRRTAAGPGRRGRPGRGRNPAR